MGQEKMSFFVWPGSKSLMFDLIKKLPYSWIGTNDTHLLCDYVSS